MKRAANKQQTEISVDGQITIAWMIAPQLLLLVKLIAMPRNVATTIAKRSVKRGNHVPPMIIHLLSEFSV